MSKVQLNLLYVNSFRDRYGKTRYYFRHRGKRWALPGDPASREFREMYETLIETVVNAKKDEGRDAKERVTAFAPLSLGFAIESYLNSPHFKKLAQSTRDYYDRYLTELKKTKWARGSLATLREKHVAEIQAEWESVPAKADVMVYLIRNVWKHAKKRLGWTLPPDPTEGFERLYQKGDGFLPWPQSVLEEFPKVVPPNIRRGFYLALYTGQRGIDVVKMKKSMFDGTAIEVKQQKTGKWRWIPCHRVLREDLTGHPFDSEWLLPSASGGPMTRAQFSGSVKYYLKKLGAEQFTLHGLRKNSTNALAEAGCSPHEISAITGMSMEMIVHYTRHVDLKRMAKAAIAKLEGRGD